MFCIKSHPNPFPGTNQYWCHLKNHGCDPSRPLTLDNDGYSSYDDDDDDDDDDEDTENVFENFTFI